MCGIAGRYHYRSAEPIDRRLLERMTATLAHRGPDGDGHWAEGPVGLGHRRLSIIDLEGGAQPMADASGRYQIVFNGEIYNFQELRAGLERQGCRFVSRSDTEVILELYAREGPDCVRRLRGMFAFALWDRQERQLMIARDRLGKKPLYYADQGGKLLFASEAKALLVDPDISRELNPHALHDFLTYQYVPAPHSMFVGIQKLPPAHYLLADADGIRTVRYWDLDFTTKRNGAEDELLAELQQLVTESVRLRMVSDVPLGAFLSGGVDSSLVVAIMAQLSDRPVKTFSIGFAEESFNEAPYARRVAQQYGTDHEEFVCRPDAVAVLPELVWHFDEPFADSSAIPTYYLAQMTRRHVTVALNGDGGDEGFAGYERYLGNRYVDLYSHVPAPLRRHVIAPIVNALPEGDGRVSIARRLRWLNAISLQAPGRRYAHSMTIFPPEEQARLYSRKLAEHLAKRDGLTHLLSFYADERITNSVNRMLYTDTMSYLPGDLLVKVDRMTMAHGLEGRSPLLDHHVLEFAASLPPQLKLHNGELKYLLKKLAAQYVPHDVIYRPKQGFGVPIAQWFRHELSGWLRDLLSDSALVQDGYFRQDGIDGFVREHVEGRANHGHRLWALVNLEVWYRTFIRREESGGMSARVGA